MTDEDPIESWAKAVAERRRARLVSPDKPMDPVTLTLTASEANHLIDMAAYWLDETSPEQVYAAEEAGAWNRKTVRSAIDKLKGGLWPIKPLPRRTRKTRAEIKISNAG